MSGDLVGFFIKLPKLFSSRCSNFPKLSLVVDKLVNSVYEWEHDNIKEISLVWKGFSFGLQFSRARFSSLNTLLSFVAKNKLVEKPKCESVNILCILTRKSEKRTRYEKQGLKVDWRSSISSFRHFDGNFHGIWKSDFIEETELSKLEEYHR